MGWGLTDVLRELLDTLVLPHNDLAVDELFHGYLGLSTLGEKICRVNHPFVISPGQDEIISVAVNVPYVSTRRSQVDSR